MSVPEPESLLDFQRAGDPLSNSGSPVGLRPEGQVVRTALREPFGGVYPESALRRMKGSGHASGRRYSSAALIFNRESTICNSLRRSPGARRVTAKDAKGR